MQRKSMIFYAILLFMALANDVLSEDVDTKPGYSIRRSNDESPKDLEPREDKEGKVTDHSRNMDSPDAVCDFCLYDGFGNITSYNYPLPYKNNLDCTYRVVRTDNDTCQLSVTFHEFDVEADSEKNCKDFLKVGRRKFCGVNKQGKTELIDFPKEANEIIFTFKTDAEGQRKGFFIEIQRVHGTCRDRKRSQTFDDLPAPPSCYFCSDGIEERLTSYGYPANYRNNMQCVYEIKKQFGNCAVQLNFSEFDLEESFKCDKDFLTVDGEKYCGTSLESETRTVKFSDEDRVRMIFKTDSKNVKKGFDLIYKQIPCDSNFDAGVCDQTFQDEEFMIKSPSYPDKYSNLADCKYRIVKANKNICSLNMTFVNFDVESSDNCKYDYLDINGQRLCGKIPDNSIKSFEFMSNEKTIEFHSDEASNRDGFLIKISQESCQSEVQARAEEPNRKSMCEFSYTGISGKFESPNFGGTYPNNLDCSYNFLKQDGYCGVELDFANFMIEGSIECSMDFLLANGRKYCGNELEGSKLILNFENGSMATDLRFISNELTSSPGFKGTYKQLSCRMDDKDEGVLGSKSDLDSIGACDKNISAYEYELRSPNYPKAYPNNRKCKYTVERRDSKICKLQLTFDKFELENGDNCEFDSLTIDGKKLCGNLPMRTVQEVSFDSSEIVMQFESDEASSKGGFVIQLKQIDCEDGGLSTTPRLPFCDETFSKTAFQISSPGYPNMYPAGSSCRFTINRANDNICLLVLEIQTFDLASSENCEDEFLMVGSEKICGSMPNKSIKKFNFREDQKMITFQSAVDFSTGNRGFLIGIEQVACSFQTFNVPTTPRPPRSEECDKFYNSPSFEILSPQFPGKYPNQKDCTYVINKSTNDVCELEVKFIRFDLEASNECKYDFLKIGEKRYCGNTPQGMTRTYSFDSNRFVMRFKSDEASTKMGFLMRVRQKKCDNLLGRKDEENKNNLCNKTINEGLVELKSPMYPNNYPDGSYCEYTINRLNDKICHLEVTYLDFDLEASPKCQYDYLDIYGERMCGVIPAGKVQLFDFMRSQKVLKFRSDEASNRAGFHLMLRQKMCKTPDVFGNSKSCNQKFRDTSFQVQSPRFTPGNSDQVECKYTVFKANENICSVNISVLNFDVGSAGDCSREYLEIDGQKLCGVISRGSSRTLFFNRNDPISMSFKALSSSSSGGFQLKFTQNECFGDELKPKELPISSPSCDLLFTRKEFMITSLKFPQNYLNDQDCDYIIERRVNVCNLAFQFVNFDLEESASCVNDYLEIDGSRLCGKFARNTLREVPFDTPTKRLRFHSNSQISKTGFEIKVIQVECVNSEPKNNLPLPNIADSDCSGIFSQSAFQIFSPNYPNIYPSFSICHYVIQKSQPNICQLEMIFDEFNVEASNNCTNDYLELSDMRICGSMPAGRRKIFQFSESQMDVTFKSDSSKNLKGFNIKIIQLPCSNTNSINLRSAIPATRRPLSGCENNYYANSGGFRSEKYPDNYLNNFDCKYQFLKADGYCGVELSFNEFALEESEGCSNDYVSLNGLSFCGRQLQGHKKTIPFDGKSQVSFMFMTDDSRTDKGFKGRYKLVPCQLQQRSVSPSTCDMVTNAPEIELTSPGYPQNYKNNQNCDYEIQRSDRSVCAIELEFLKFDLESDGGCHKDYFIADGLKFCGTLPKSQKRVIPFKSDERRKVFKFHSNEMRSRSGFLIKARQLRECPTLQARQNDFLANINSPPTLCDFCLHNETGFMTSVNYPNNYMNNLYCSYRVEALPGYCSMEVFFKNFDLEESRGCEKDFLEIEGQKYCSDSLNLMSMKFEFPKSKEIKFMFRTDDRITKRGFHAVFKQSKCQEPKFRANDFRQQFGSRDSAKPKNMGHSFSGYRSNTDNFRRNDNRKGFFRNSENIGAQLNPAVIVSNQHYIKSGGQKPIRSGRDNFSSRNFRNNDINRFYGYN